MILAVDTSGPLVAVTVTDPDGVPRYAARGTRPRAHAEEIGPLVAAGTAGADISHVVAGRGPGSFTGLRVGLAFAQAWAWGRDTPVSGMCSLDAIAVAAGLATGWVVTDARRGELFAAPYRDGVRSGDTRVLPRAAAAELVAGSDVAGDVALLTDDDRRAAGTTAVVPEALARAAALSVRDDPGGSLQPDYLRRPDVTLRAGS